MGRFRAATLLFAALAAGLLLAACGSNSNGELLPGTTATEIESNLDQVRSNAEEGNCEAAEIASAEVSTEVDGLQKVDKQLKKALKEGAAKLSELVSSCGVKEEEAEQAEEEKAQEAEEDEEQAALEAEEEEAAEKEAEKDQKAEEREEKAKEKAEGHAEQPGPPEEGEESGPKGKAKGHEEEEIETPEEEVIPPTEGGPAGGIGPGAEVGGSD
jgi:hypothetical protein